MSKQSTENWLAETVATQAASPARQLLTKLFDLGTFTETNRLTTDGVVTGFGRVDGAPVYAYAQDRSVCCGAVGKAEADKIRSIYELAAANGAPVVAVFDSDGAKLGEGIDAMNALSEILTATTRLSGVVPMFAVINGACVGSASLIAAACDVIVKREDADFYLNPGDAPACADITVADEEALLNTLHQLLSYFPSNNLETAAVYEFDAPLSVPTSTEDAAQKIADADDFLELAIGGESKAALARHHGQQNLAAQRNQPSVVFGHAGGIEQHKQQRPKLLLFAGKATRTAIQRQHVQRHAVRDIQIGLLALDAGGLQVAHRQKRDAVHAIGGGTLTIISRIGLGVPDLLERFIIGARHKDVHIVIPGNKPAVAHGADTTAAAQIKPQMMRLAKIAKIA